MIIYNLEKAGVITPPPFIKSNTVYLAIMGSMAYGVSSDTSDMDIYGFCFPPKTLMFPHLAGEIPGFGRQIQKFEQWQQHHVVNPSKPDTVYDFSVYSIVKYFQLCMENNPNMIDSLFVPRNCVIHSTQISELVRENRRIFLHKGSYHKLRGYAYSQLSKIKNKVSSSNPKRAADIEKYGYSTKFAYHLVRLALESEQILTTHDLDLQRDNEVLKSIRRGEWTLERLIKWFEDKERNLEALYVSSTLQHSPDESKIKTLLMNCIEQHYGTISTAITIDNNISDLIKDLDNVISKYKKASL